MITILQIGHDKTVLQARALLLRRNGYQQSGRSASRTSRDRKSNLNRRRHEGTQRKDKISGNQRQIGFFALCMPGAKIAQASGDSLKAYAEWLTKSGTAFAFGARSMNEKRRNHAAVTLISFGFPALGSFNSSTPFFNSACALSARTGAGSSIMRQICWDLRSL